jgi:hypothetical protein
MKNENKDFKDFFIELEEIWNGGIFGELQLWGFDEDYIEEKPFRVSDNNDSPNSSTSH